MPMPSVEPRPLLPSEVRLGGPVVAQDASYLAASARMLSLSMSSMGHAYYCVDIQYRVDLQGTSHQRTLGRVRSHHAQVAVGVVRGWVARLAAPASGRTAHPIPCAPAPSPPAPCCPDPASPFCA